MFSKIRPILPILLLTLAACGGGQEEAPAGDTAAAAPPATEAPAADSAPVGPISSRGTVPSGAAAAGESAELDFALPAGWQSETPSSNMRLAQASIPGPGGPGQLT